MPAHTNTGGSVLTLVKMSIMTKVTVQVGVLEDLKQGFALDTRSHPTAV